MSDSKTLNFSTNEPSVARYFITLELTKMIIKEMSDIYPQRYVDVFNFVSKNLYKESLVDLEEFKALRG